MVFLPTHIIFKNIQHSGHLAKDKHSPLFHLQLFQQFVQIGKFGTICNQRDKIDHFDEFRRFRTLIKRDLIALFIGGVKIRLNQINAILLFHLQLDRHVVRIAKIVTISQLKQRVIKQLTHHFNRELHRRTFELYTTSHCVRNIPVQSA